MTVRKQILTHLCRKGVPLYLVLGPLVILRTVMYVYLFKLVAICQRTAGNVDMVFVIFVHSEHQRLSGVVKRPAHLQQRRTVV